MSPPIPKDLRKEYKVFLNNSRLTIEKKISETVNLYRFTKKSGQTIFIETHLKLEEIKMISYWLNKEQDNLLDGLKISDKENSIHSRSKYKKDLPPTPLKNNNNSVPQTTNINSSNTTNKKVEVKQTSETPKPPPKTSQTIDSELLKICEILENSINSLNQQIQKFKSEFSSQINSLKTHISKETERQTTKQPNSSKKLNKQTQEEIEENLRLERLENELNEYYASEEPEHDNFYFQDSDLFKKPLEKKDKENKLKKPLVKKKQKNK